MRRLNCKSGFTIRELAVALILLALGVSLALWGLVLIVTPYGGLSVPLWGVAAILLVLTTILEFSQRGNK